MKRNKWWGGLWLVIAILAGVGMIYAGTTGKIAGRVIDAQTGDPLPGANIVIEGTHMGTASDVDGYYVILNVPPGTYTLKASMLGYQPMVVKKVVVDADRTTEINFSLKQTAIVTEEVVVTAKEPTIKKDLTASVTIVKGEELENLPINTVADVVTQQAGVINRGGLHIRGGRPDEVVYVVDGVEVRDPYNNTTMAGIPLVAMEEASTFKGGFDVDQGTVASGAINVVTKEGRDKYEFTTRMTTSDLSMLGDKVFAFFDANLGDPYLDALLGKNFDLSDPVGRHKRKQRITEISLGGPLLPSWRKGAKFFISSEFNNHAGRFPVSNDPHWRNWTENYQWKLTLPFSSIKFFTSGFWRYSKTRDYDPQWRLALDHLNVTTDKHIQLTGGMDHIISPKTYWSLRFGYYKRDNRFYNFEDVDNDGVDDFDDRDLDGFVEIDIDYFIDSLGNLMTDFLDSIGAEIHGGYVEVPYYWWESFVTSMHPRVGGGPKWWPVSWRQGWGQSSQVDTFVVTPDGDTIDIGNLYLFDNHTWDRNVFYVRQVKTFSIKWRLQSQVTRNHEILTGFEYKKHNVMRYGIDYASGSNIYLSMNNPPFQRRSGDPYNVVDWFNDHPCKPWAFAAYARDKIEMEGMVAKVGFRLDYFDPGGWVISDPDDPFVRDSVSNQIRYIKDPKPAKKKWYISPRIGISHPISERDVLHFTYGHYYQIPALWQLIRDYAFSGAFPLFGNADLDPEKVISYELGVKHAFTANTVIDVTAYYKDISDWARVKQFPYGVSGENYSMPVNEDYGSVRGVEFELTKRSGGELLPFWNFNLSYTYQIARGSFSNPFDAYDWMWRGYPLPPTDSPLDWDQRHRLFVTLGYYAPKDKPTFGIKGFDNWGFSIQYNYGSGFPYTPPIKTLREAIENINAKRLPSTQNTNLRIFKQFAFGPVSIRAFMDMNNVFNRKDLVGFNNVDWYTQFGDPEGEVKDPTVWSARRTTRVGIELKISEM